MLRINTTIEGGDTSVVTISTLENSHSHPNYQITTLADIRYDDSILHCAPNGGEGPVGILVQENFNTLFLLDDRFISMIVMIMITMGGKGYYTLE